MFFGVVHLVGCAFFIFKYMERKEITALFVGNRDCYFIKEEYIEQAIIAAIHMGIRIFLNGGMGHFDETCAKVLHKLKERYPTLKVFLLQPIMSPALRISICLTRLSIRLRNSWKPTFFTNELSPKGIRSWFYVKLNIRSFMKSKW